MHLKAFPKTFHVIPLGVLVRFPILARMLVATEQPRECAECSSARLYGCYWKQMLSPRYMRYIVTGGSGTNEPAVKFNPGIITYDEADVLLCAYSVATEEMHV